MKASAIGIIAAVLAAGLPSGARGATLATPWVFSHSGIDVVCVATNIGTKDAEVSVSLTNQYGVVVAPYYGDCVMGGPTTLTAGTSCYLDYLSLDGYCAFAVKKGKVRAALELLEGPVAKVVVPATK